jgi:8-oxo-dGTP pyrophosphatase MutT (NUDIX family)
MSEPKTKRKVQVVVFARQPELRVLVLRRPPKRGHIWQPITGNVDRSDASLSDAARRELEEETGIRDLVHLIDTEFDFSFLKGGFVVFERLIGIEVASVQPVVLSREHVEYRWLPPEQALDHLEWDINKKGLRRVICAGGHRPPPTAPSALTGPGG